MARTTPKPPTRRTRNSPARPLRASQPRRPRSPARNRTAHRSGPPRRPFRGALAEARSNQPAPVSGGRHVRLQGDALGDGRHGEKPRTRSATGIHPRQPQAGSRHRVRTQAVGSARNWRSLTASTSAEAGASEFDPSSCRRLYATLRRVEKPSCPPATACPVWSQKPSETASRRQRDHARTRPYHPPENRSFPDRAVPVHHLPQDRRGHVPAADQDQRQRERLA